jgi:hypothetical protein
VKGTPKRGVTIRTRAGADMRGSGRVDTRKK